jgi:hypothetical protein
MMDYGRSFQYMFKDKDWLVKIIIGGVFALLSFIVVGIPFVIGYMLEVVRNVIAGQDEPLPAWDNLGDKFVQGLLMLVVLLIVGIPMYLFACIQGVFSAIVSNSNSNALITLGGLIALLMSLLEFLYGLLMAVFMPALLLRFATTRRIGDTLKFGELWQIVKANFGQYILIIILVYIVQLVAGFGAIACVIGVFLTYFWAMLVQSHLYGQYYRNYVTHAGPLMPPAGYQPMPPAPPAAPL